MESTSLGSLCLHAATQKILLPARRLALYSAQGHSWPAFSRAAHAEVAHTHAEVAHSLRWRRRRPAFASCAVRSGLRADPTALEAGYAGASGVYLVARFSLSSRHTTMRGAGWNHKLRHAAARELLPLEPFKHGNNGSGHHRTMAGPTALKLGRAKVPGQTQQLPPVSHCHTTNFHWGVNIGRLTHGHNTSFKPIMH